MMRMSPQGCSFTSASVIKYSDKTNLLKKWFVLAYISWLQYAAARSQDGGELEE